MPLPDIYVALIHFPVMNRKGQPIGSALTTIDMHDIARASMTFGVKGFFVVTPYEDQAALAAQVIDHWTKGVGGKLNPSRKKALELIQVSENFDSTIELMKEQTGKPVVTIGTSAKKHAASISIRQLKNNFDDRASHVLVFGTAWGLAEEIMNNCNFILEPISGNTGYNHLSVRSAVSIYLDRIINGR